MVPAEDTSAASVRPAWAVTGTTVAVPLVRRTTSLTSSVLTAVTIGTGGGKISVPGAGLLVTIPSGAVSQPLTISVTAVQGQYATFEFGPHGTTFNKPITVTLDLKTLALDASTQPNLAYFADSTHLDATTGQVQADELWAGKMDYPSKGKLTFSIVHFSGYTVSGGILVTTTLPMP
jgi:hypothetical protein